MSITYRAEAHVTGTRADGHGETSDGRLAVDLRLPKELGGDGDGTNPEQLFAVGDGTFRLGAELDVTLPSAGAAAEDLVRAAHQLCPYSRAIRGNVEVVLTANGTKIVSETGE